MTKNFNKKNLTICIEDIDEMADEEQINRDKIINEIELLKNSCHSYSHYIQNQANLRNNLLSKNNAYLNQLLFYMDGENYLSDLSYYKIIKNNDIQNISKSIFIQNYYDINNFLLNEQKIKSEFNLLKLITETPNHKNLQIDILKNLKRYNNRYSDILPYDYNSVKYQTNLANDYNKSNQNDWYINASFINGPFKSDKNSFIAAQTPVLNTIGKFYKMCFNNNIKILIMLCCFEEEGRKKCEYYLPNQINEEISFDNNSVKVKIINEEFLIKNCLIKREISITINNQTKNIYHLQMLNWPDYSKPDGDIGYETVNYLINVMAQSRECFPDSPILIHCSAGTGRTGTLIAIFNLIKCISFFQTVNNDNSISPFFSVFNMVRRLREQRSGMVACFEQYKFIYHFIFNWIQRNILSENNY